MSRYFAFLRAINVGGHTVKMTVLRQLFESFGFAEVETFIASGNVIFQSPLQDAGVLAQIISSGLRVALGYEVTSFIRSQAELQQLAFFPAFPPSEVDQAKAYNIAFLSERLDDHAIKKVANLTTDIDRFVTHDREVYWLCQKLQSQSSFSNLRLEKTLGVRSTIRAIATVRKLAARYI